MLALVNKIKRSNTHLNLDQLEISMFKAIKNLLSHFIMQQLNCQRGT